MQQFKLLERLLGFEPAGFPVISLYLNTEPNETGKKDFDVFLRNQLSEHGAVLEEGSSEKESFGEDAKRINEYVEGLDASARSVAVFASSGSDGFYERFQFQTPFEENEFHVADSPFLYPLIRLMSQNPTFAVVSADTNQARILVFRRGKTVEKEEIQNVKTNRTEVGGWSQMRYQRHIDNFHQQHAKEVVQELEKIVRDENIDRVILAGNESVIIPILRAELSKELEEKVVSTLPLTVDTPEHELYERAREAVENHEVDDDKEKVEYLLENNYDDGIGVVGLEKTLTALMNGQVQELYVLSDLSQIRYDRNTVRSILKAYEPGEEGETPDAAERELLVDQVLKRAAQSADRIRFIRDPDLLQTHGGIGAILRYRAKGVSNL